MSNRAPLEPAGAEYAPTGEAAERARRLARRNTWTFGPGTFGRDMLYTLVSMYLVYYLTEVVRPGDAAIFWLTGVLMLVARLFDAFMDFVMGTIVDNTRTRWGQYKPWIAGGALASGLVTVALFTDLGVRGPLFIVGFALVYLLWSLAWTTNDIPYWSLLPALSVDQGARERMGAVAKTFGTLGLFIVAIGILPVTEALATQLGGLQHAWFAAAVALVVIMIAFQAITLFGVRQPAGIRPPAERTSLRGMVDVLAKNDQLVWTGICMVLFATGYQTTTTFGTYFFKYAFKNEGMYPVFAAVLGVANLAGFLTFPLLARLMPRKRLYTVSIVMILVGYTIFGFSPMSIVPLAVSGLIMFLAEAWLVMLMLVFLTDTIEYGQWKSGKRNGAITFALQPFIWKASAALATAIVGITTVVSGISRAQTPADVSPQGLLIMKLAMLVLPVILITVSWLLYLRKYRIDKALYDQIVADLRARGQLD